MHQGTWQTLCSRSWNAAVDPVWGPPTLLTTSNIVFNRSSVNAASVTLVRLPGTHYLTASSSSRTLVDLNSFSSLIYCVFVFVFVFVNPSCTSAITIRSGCWTLPWRIPRTGGIGRRQQSWLWESHETHWLTDCQWQRKCLYRFLN